MRRGESDREAVRIMREIVRDGHALGLFVEGTRQRSGVPGQAQPGAAMVALQENVPVVPAAIHGSQYWKVGNFHPVSIAWGEPMTLRGAPQGRQGLPRGLGDDPGGDPPPLALARRAARGGQAARRSDPAVSTDELLGTVAVVGFPNVGKSTLVNRLTGSRQAVVHETPGVTRDRKEVVCEWAGQRFLLVDTGGVDIADPSPLTQQVADQARRAIAEADLVLFVVDTRNGITPGDEELAAILRRSRKPIFLIANKIDEPGREAEALEFHRLGLGDPIPISAIHGHGTGDLLDAIVARLPGSGPAEAGEEAIRVAILGRPNVGKSSLLNALLGEERVIVSEQPGTTRDAIDTVLRRGDQTFVLVDTAGHQAQAQAAPGNRVLLGAARAAGGRARRRGARPRRLERGRRRAGPRGRRHRAEVDVVDARRALEVGHRRGRDRGRARAARAAPAPAPAGRSPPRPRPSRGVGKLLDRVEELYGKYTSRVPTGELNRFLQELREVRQPPSRNGKRLNLLYGTQTTVRPPRFRFFVNDPGLITRDYGYWVENQLREKFDLEGVPVAIDFVRRS